MCTGKLQEVFQAVRDASRFVALLSEEVKANILKDLAEAVLEQTPFLLEENRKDLEKMSSDDPKYDRLRLTESRLKDISLDLQHVAHLSSPLGTVISEEIRPNGMLLKRVRVPFGVVAVIYEARPNVSFDVFSLCLKTGNACILKGGHEAELSNKAIVTLIKNVLLKHGIPGQIVELLPSSREATTELLHADGYVDLLIPRGSGWLIRYVRENSKIPVIETGAGVCHTYFDSDGDVKKGAAIVCNAKTRRVSVCNALDCLIIHRDRLKDLSEICSPLEHYGVKIYADERAYAALEGNYPQALLQLADAECFGVEFLDYKMSVRTVDSLEEALQHIAKYGSKHSECIVTENEEHAECFLQSVDAACVYSNVSTAFTDGGQFGLGAEIGISTQKLHARGPMGLEALTTYKWVIRGNGQIRER